MQRMWIGSPRAVAGMALVAAVLGLGGCNIEPHYRVEVLGSDPGLAGMWEIQPKPEDGKEKDPVRFEIRTRQVSVEDGRVCPDKVFVETGRAAEAYTITLPLPGVEPPHEYGAFLVAAGERRLLAFQFVSGGGTGPIGVHPLHQVVRCKRDGDELELAWPKYPIALMPAAQPLDGNKAAAGAVPSLEDLERRKEGGVFVVFDVDRLVEVYKAHAAEPGFWGGAVVARRVRSAGETGQGGGAESPPAGGDARPTPGR